MALQESGDNPTVGGTGHHVRRESNGSVFSEEEGPVRHRRRRHRVRHGVKRYRTQRSRNGSSDSSTKGRRSLRPMARRLDVQYTCSESDEESTAIVSDIDRIMGNYPPRSVRETSNIN